MKQEIVLVRQKLRQSKQRKHCASFVESQSLTFGFIVSDAASVSMAIVGDNYVCDFCQCAVITGARSKQSYARRRR